MRVLGSALALEDVRSPAAFVATILQTAVEPSQLSVSLTATALLFLTIRAAGDDRRVGFTKTHRASAFGRADDSVFTPLISVLAFGAFAALLPA